MSFRGFRDMLGHARRPLVLLTVLAIGAAAAAAAYAGAGDPTFGNTGTGSASSAPGAGYKFGSVFTLPEDGTTVDIQFHATGGTADQSFVPVVYNTSSGTPTTLAAQGSTVTVKAGDAAQWYTSTLPSTSLKAGDYLLGLVSGPTGGKGKISYDAGSSGDGIYNFDPSAYPNPPSDWGSVNLSNQLLSIYVEYQKALQAAGKKNRHYSSTAQTVAVPPSPSRTGYCMNGKFLNLLLGQPLYDPNYIGATPAPYYEGVGLTCDSLPGYATKTIQSVDGSGDQPELVDGQGNNVPGNESTIHPFFAKLPA